MKVLIIEDEPLVAKDIQHLLLRVEPTASVVGIVSSVDESRKWFETHEEPDLVLSDIQLSDGNSFEVFESLEIHSPVIFTTAYDDYAIRAFKINSIDYLLKPIDADELSKAIKKWKTMSSRPEGDERLKMLLKAWGKSTLLYKERFLVVQGNSLVPLRQEDIAVFHKDQLIYVHNVRNEKFVCEFHALDDLEEVLNPSIFFRVNRQFILHIQAVGKVKTTHKGLTVVLKAPLDMEIDISREKATAFKNWLG